MEKVDIVSAELRIKEGAVTARYNIRGGGRTERTLSIAVPDGITHISHAPAGFILKATNLAIIKSHQLKEEGALSGRPLFSKAMSDYMKWHEPRHRGNNKYAVNVLIDAFGGKRVGMISREDVRTFISGLEPDLSTASITAIIARANAFYNWMLTEGIYEGASPFKGHTWHGSAPGLYIAPSVSAAMFQHLCSLIRSRQVLQAVVHAYYTGQRAAECVRITTKDIDHDNQIIRIRESKTRIGYKNIATSKAHLIWIANNGLVPVCEATVQQTLCRLKHKYPELEGICMDAFRKNYAHIMISAGAEPFAVDLHMGHINTVLAKHYLQNPDLIPALMRPWMRVFDGEFGDNLGIAKKK